MHALLGALSRGAVEFVVIGGVAVIAHGVIRTTRDVDVCPSPERANLVRLANVLRNLGARQLGVGDGEFAEDEMPFDPTDPDDLAQGGNFRLRTPFGVLDVMQWIPGIEADHAYSTLAADAETATAFGVELRVSSLAKLRLMKEAAGRPRDLQDLEDLAAAHPEADAGG
jgi:hypothetical protein